MNSSNAFRSLGLLAVVAVAASPSHAASHATTSAVLDRDDGSRPTADDGLDSCDAALRDASENVHLE